MVTCYIKLTTPDPDKPDPVSRYPVFHFPSPHEPLKITQPFGVNPAWYEPLGVPAHEGLDIAAPEGTPIECVSGGVVSRVGWHSAYGNHIRVKHLIDDVAYESVYAHFVEASHLLVGHNVLRAQIVGKAGSTGNSTGPHLHFMLKQYNGEKPDTEAQKKYDWNYNIIDPTPFFAELNE